MESRSDDKVAEVDITDVLNALLEVAPAELLQQTNEAGSPPVHWAVMNNHVACVQALVDVPEERGGGLPLLKVSPAPAKLMPVG